MSQAIPTTPERIAEIKQAATHGRRTLYVYEDPDAPEQLHGVVTTPFLQRTPLTTNVWSVRPNGIVNMTGPVIAPA